jgi:predicted methyltransferase
MTGAVAEVKRAVVAQDKLYILSFVSEGIAAEQASINAITATRKNWQLNREIRPIFISKTNIDIARKRANYNNLLNWQALQSAKTILANYP